MKVDIAIVGFQKAGTTSIKNYLSQHSSICSHKQMEMTYFSVQEEYDKGYEWAVKNYFEDYSIGKNVVAKHATLIRHRESVLRLYEHNPLAKIIVCLRDPVKRAYSSYLMEETNGSVSMPFDSVLEKAFDENSRGLSNWHYNVFVRLGEYVNYIDMLTSVFPVNQVFFVKIEDFYKQPETVLGKLLTFLDLPLEGDIDIKKEHNVYKTSRSPMLSRIIKEVVSPNSKFRVIARMVFPQKRISYFGELLRSLNKKKASKKEMSSWAKELLTEHYRSFNEMLNEKYQIKY